LTIFPSDFKVFVWDDVLCDYTPGLVVCIAKTKEEAISLFWHGKISNEPVPDYCELKNTEPEVYPLEPQCHFTYGGA